MNNYVSHKSPVVKKFKHWRDVYYFQDADPRVDATGAPTG
ncbi:hypothetical protein HMPREF9086_4194 [Enterobacter hormaechei ATCC 49162]|nr:hypothetical protein HMPREF9086_4194 [Enterobacter hormaechei ATCC 49162]